MKAENIEKAKYLFKKLEDIELKLQPKTIPNDVKPTGIEICLLSQNLKQFRSLMFLYETDKELADRLEEAFHSTLDNYKKELIEQIKQL